MHGLTNCFSSQLFKILGFEDAALVSELEELSRLIQNESKSLCDEIFANPAPKRDCSVIALFVQRRRNER